MKERRGVLGLEEMMRCGVMCVEAVGCRDGRGGPLNLLWRAVPKMGVYLDRGWAPFC